MNILITGGCGFVGSSLAIHFKTLYPKYRVIVFDNLHRMGSDLNLKRLLQQGVEFVHGDVRIASDFSQLNEIDFIIDAAAEPSVQAGLDGSPNYLIETNFMGTYHTLELAKRTHAGIVFLSTSRVYSIPALEKINYYEAESRFQLNANQLMSGITENGINEAFTIGDYRSLYGTTKLASEMLVQEYNALFGVKTVINRCGVLTGPWQMGKVDQGFIVLWMAKHFWKGELSYLGYGGGGKQVRDILHVHDLFRLVDWQIHHITQINGTTFNVGGGFRSSVSLYELTLYCANIVGRTISIGSIADNRKADIPIYVTDNSLINQATGWYPHYSIEDTLSEIFEWMSVHEDILRPILS